MIEKSLSRSGTWRGLILPLSLLVTWAIASSLGLGNRALFVSPWLVLQGAAEAINDGSLPGALLATIVRALLGWALGAASGIAVGLVLGLSNLSQIIAAPTLNATRQIALFAWVPLLSAWLGTGEAMKIVLIGLAAFFPVALSVEAGCRLVPRPYREIGKLLELSPREELLRIIVPAAAPSILSGLEVGLALAWIGTIGAEYLIGTGYMNATANGLGVFLAASREYARMDLVITGVISLALAGLVLNYFIVRLIRKTVAWR